MARRQFSTADALLDAGGLASSDSVTGKRKTPRRSPRGRENNLPPVSLSTYNNPSSSARPSISIPANMKFALAALLIATTVILLGMKACSSLQEAFVSADLNPQQEAPADTVDEPTQESISQIDREALSYLMGSDLAAQMVLLSALNSDLRWIAMNYEALGVDGARAQNKLLKLATLEPAARSFVRNYPDMYPDDSPEPCDSLSDDVDIPLLMQWDQRWGYTVYSSAAFGQTGCCPTSLAMVYQGITRKTDMSPYDMGVLAKENGFMTQYEGTDGQFLVTCGQQLGLAASEIPMSSDGLRWALSEGYVVIANVGPGDFTEGGHFLVVAGLAENGEAIVNDPYSVEKSERTWSIETIVNQSKALYMFAR